MKALVPKTPTQHEPLKWATAHEIAFIARLGIGMHSNHKMKRLDVLIQYRNALEKRDRTPFDKKEVLAALDNLILEIQEKAE